MRRAVFAVALSLFACETADQIPTQPVRTRDAAVDLDSGTPDVRSLPEAGADVGGDGATDATLADGPPAQPDSTFAPPGPWYEQAMVLSARSDAWVVLRSGTAVYAQRFASVAATWTVGARTLLGQMAEDGPLLATRTRSVRPWVVFPGTDGELLAFDLNADTPEGRRTGLYAPARLVGHDSVEAALLVGHLPDGGGVAHVAFEGGELSAPVADRIGAGFPTAVAAGLQRWVLGYASGVCAALDARQAFVGHWHCGIAANDLLVGTSGSLLAIGQRGDDVVMAAVAPGVTEPEPEPVPEPDAGGLDAAVGVPDAAAPPDFEAFDEEPFDDSVEDVPAFDAGVESADLGPLPGQTVLVRDARLVRQVHAMPGERVALVVEEDDEDVVWLVGPNPSALQRIPLSDEEEAALLMGVAENAGGLALVLWDAELREPERVAVDAPSRQSPPAFESELCEAPGLPTCEAAADACGGQALCCLDDDGAETDIPAFVPRGAWHISRSALGEQVLAQQAEQLALYALPPGATPVERARWTGVQRVIDFAASGDDAVALADVTIDEVTDQRLLRPPPEPGGESRVEDTACRPALAVGFRDGVLRTYCDGVAQHAALAIPYPLGDVRWISRRAGGSDNTLLVAVGDAHTLHLWRDGADAIVDAGRLPPLAVLALTPEERAVPIHLPVERGGWVSRVRDGELEVLVAGVGWVPVTGSAWPVVSVVSRRLPIAASVALRSPPNAGGEAPVGLYLHDLRGGSSPLGREVDQAGSSDNVRGLGLADFDALPGQPVVYWGLGSILTEVRRFEVSCR